MIKRVKMYKYLGVIFEENMKNIETKKDRLKKGRAAEAMIRAMGIEYGLKPEIASSLTNAILNQTLLYSAEVWGEDTWTKADVLRKRVEKLILKCQVDLPSEVVWGDLGWWTRDYYTREGSVFGKD